MSRVLGRQRDLVAPWRPPAPDAALPDAALPDAALPDPADPAPEPDPEPEPAPEPEPEPEPELEPAPHSETEPESAPEAERAPERPSATTYDWGEHRGTGVTVVRHGPRPVRRRGRRTRPARAGSETRPAATRPSQASRAERRRGMRRVESRPPSAWWGRGLVAVVFAACLSLPWLLPGITDAFAPAAPAVHPDPPVAAPVQGPVAPVGVKIDDLFLRGRLQAAGRPVRVVVPRLSVDSRIVPISGQTGVLLPPSDPQVLGWWREGRPAGVPHGTMVLTGHTVHSGGGALDHLDSLRPGDRVNVYTPAGEVVYAVQSREVMGTDTFAARSGTLLRQDGHGRLVMITCDDWDGTRYLSSAVVIARPVQDVPSAH